MAGKKRDPGKGITVIRECTPNADDGKIFSQLFKRVLGVDVKVEVVRQQVASTKNFNTKGGIMP